ncbi:TetR/AcrR family transcriptional regulator [Pedobacter yulinensis]|uniref:TetR/AcrR family transcriptional regulator n=1 Tax=Pedobacter yulinensis TaxID=2126353 RepID=A0A2T3HRR0_9SPHI|nr:TetR/AcrR family transcriptional regulator [Pedobacter yulinensis]PST85132.1 TetR/AcrR family transcriptional regulator [Pedobacter yulinensis]
MDKRTSILRAAEKLFCELGYEGTSTRSIAREAGANMAMINYYFGSKEGVFVEIMTERIKAFGAQLTVIDEDRISPMEKLKKVIEGYAERIFLNTSFHKMMHRELSLAQRPEMYEKIKGAISTNLEVFEHIVTAGIESGDFRPVDVRMLIATIMGTISNVASSPGKVTGNTLDISNPKDRDILKERLINHLKELAQTFLEPKK